MPAMTCASTATRPAPSRQTRWVWPSRTSCSASAADRPCTASHWATTASPVAGATVVPVTGQLDLKGLADAVAGKKASMAPKPDAERATGYVVGGISPLGQRTAHPTVLDETVWLFDTVLVSGRRRGLDVELSPDDLVRLTSATVADIARSDP